jgi:splicing factor 3A subunit 3
METTLEQARRFHEEIEQAESAAVYQLLQKPKTHKDQMLQQIRIKKMIDLIQEKSKQLLKLYRDDDGLMAVDISSISVLDDLSEYYNRLEFISDHYKSRRSALVKPFHPKDVLKNEEDEMVELEAMFTGDESFGRHLDLHELFNEYTNIKGVNRLDYLTYLDRFDRFKDIPLEVKKSRIYYTYLKNMHEYLVDWIKRSQPLFNYEQLESDTSDEFERLWQEGTVPTWPKPTISASETSFYCLACISN